MRRITIYAMGGIMGLFLWACSEEQEVKISTGAKNADETLKQAESVDRASYAGLEDVFLDTKHLYTNKDDKLTLFIFARNNCFYCDKLKGDIAQNSQLKQTLQERFLPYYINSSYTKKHILYRGEDTQSFNTHQLIESYVKSPLRPTPTLVFVDTQGKSIYELPGYLPSESMIKILDYMASGKWKGKDVKQINNEIREELL